MQKTYLNTTEQDDMSDGARQATIPVAKGNYQRDMLLAALPEEFTHEDFSYYSKIAGISSRTLERWTAEWTEKGILHKTSHGNYKKVA